MKPRAVDSLIHDITHLLAIIYDKTDDVKMRDDIFLILDRCSTYLLEMGERDPNIKEKK